MIQADVRPLQFVGVGDVLPLKVLLVEDSKIDATILTQELIWGGLDPVIKRVETEAGMRSSLKKEPWNIIIADYNLPGFNALKAIKILKASKLDIPLIVVSGTVGEDVAVETMQAGAKDYVMKDCIMRLVPAIKRELADWKIRQKSRQTLNEVQRAKDLIISTLAHDLKSPTMIAIHLLEKLRNGDFGTINKVQNELLQELLHSRQYERHLVDNILSVYSEKTNNFGDRFTLTNINQFLSEKIIPIFQYMAESKNITLTFKLSTDLPKINVVPHDIQRVFNNLLYNAFMYTNSNGKITVESGIRDNNALFIVKDTGIGIAPEYLEALFHQCEPTNNRFKSGAGLGLYLSKKIIDAHGGKIWVETQLGKGSQFFLTLPLLHSI